KGELKNEDFVNNLSTGQLTEVLKNKEAAKAIGRAAEDWTKTIKDSVLQKISGGFSDNFDDSTDPGKDNIRMRNTHAKISRDYSKSYFMGDRSDQQYSGDLGAQKSLSLAVSKMKQNDWEKIKDSPENYSAMALSMNANQVNSAGRVLTGEQKNDIANIIEDIVNNPGNHNLDPNNANPNKARQDQETIDRAYQAWGTIVSSDLWATN
ncbi:hypothetical protein D4R86_04335, partial [bacterium]